MFTRKPVWMLVLAILAAAPTLPGCQDQPSPDKYGEIITEVPPELNRPFPLPELEDPPETGGKAKE